MLIVIFVLTILLTLGYVILILLLYRGLFFLKPGKNKIQYDVSVVIAARNEQENIGSCLEALSHQSYPAERYEVIVVDDRSTDRTVAIVADYGKKHSRIKLVQIEQLPPGVSPKKHALEKGIGIANGEIILTTDADCVPQPGWIAGMVSYFKPAVGLVAGFSPLVKAEGATIFSRLVTLDSLSLAAVAAGSFGLGKPLTCNGRNLAYRKAAFQAIDGFKAIQHLISGDDDLLLHQLRQKTDWQFRYAIDPETIVRSKAPPDFRHLANQRIRHASKGRYYSSWLKLSLAAVYLFNLILLALVPILFFVSKLFWLWLTALLIKSFSELLLLARFAEIYKYKKALSIFLLAILLHVPYVVIFGLWGQVGKFQWKEDTFQATTTQNCQKSN